MWTREELAAHQFVKTMLQTSRPHIECMALAVPIFFRKITMLPGVHWWRRTKNQNGFDYTRPFKARFSHAAGTRLRKGRLEVVGHLGSHEGEIVCWVDSLDAAMAIDLQATLDNFLARRKAAWGGLVVP